MKFIPLFILLGLFYGCQAQQNPAIPPTSETLEELHWKLRDAMRMQLPATYPAERASNTYKKNYSLDFQWSAEKQTFIIELPEKRLDVASEQITGGSKYFIPFNEINIEEVRLIYSADETQAGLLIPARENKTFLFHPYGNEPDEQVGSVMIGWYDRVQDHTLDRVLILWKQFLIKMGEQEKIKLAQKPD